MAAARGAFGLSRAYRLAELGTTTSPADSLGPEWLVELALDGHRVMVCRFDDDVRIVSSDLRDWGQTFPTLTRALQQLRPRRLVIEGWLCALDAAGRPSFEALRAHAAATARPRLMFAASDLLHVDGEDLRRAPLETRRRRLKEVLEPPPPGVALSGAIAASVQDALRLVGPGVTAVLARRADSTYPPAEWAAFPGPPPHRGLSPPPVVTNASKVLYPRDGFTKQTIVDFYRSIADAILPYLRDRPVVCQRWPDGIDDFTWYQHRPPPRAPDYLRSVAFEGDRRLVIDDVDGLCWMVNQAALTFHGWTSRVGSLERPDWLVIDLDPGSSTPWAQTIEVAIAVRKLLELLELPSVPKTSGQKGLHVMIPIAAEHRVDEVHEVARRIAALIARTLPSLTTLEGNVEKRAGRLYLDVTQNFVGKTWVLPYSLRAVDGAPVSTPLRWNEVTERLDPGAFTLRTIRARLEACGDLAAPLLSGTVKLGRVLARLPP